MYFFCEVVSIQGLATWGWKKVGKLWSECEKKKERRRWTARNLENESGTRNEEKVIESRCESKWSRYGRMKELEEGDKAWWKRERHERKEYTLGNWIIVGVSGKLVEQICLFHLVKTEYIPEIREDVTSVIGWFIFHVSSPIPGPYIRYNVSQS